MTKPEFIRRVSRMDSGSAHYADFAIASSSRVAAEPRPTTYSSARHAITAATAANATASAASMSASVTSSSHPAASKQAIWSTTALVQNTSDFAVS